MLLSEPETGKIYNASATSFIKVNTSFIKVNMSFIKVNTSFIKVNTSMTMSVRSFLSRDFSVLTDQPLDTCFHGLHVASLVILE